MAAQAPRRASGVQASTLDEFRLQVLRCTCAVGLFSSLLRIRLWASAHVWQEMDVSLVVPMTLSLAIYPLALVFSTPRSAAVVGAVILSVTQVMTLMSALRAGPYMFRFLQSSTTKFLPVAGAAIVDERFSFALMCVYMAQLWYSVHVSTPESFDRGVTLGMAPDKAFFAGVINEVVVIFILTAIACSTTAFLKRSLEKAADALDIRRRFITNMNHEIRTPLVGLLGTIDIMMAQPDVPSHLRHYIELAHQTGNGLLALVNNILDLSKIDARKLQLDAKPVDVVKLVETVVFTFSGVAANKGVKLRQHIDADVPRVVVADEQRLTQVLCNLFGNACKFTNEGFISIRVHLRAAAPAQTQNAWWRWPRTRARGTQAQLMLIFQVSDTGVGIAPQHHAAVFDAFEQVKQKGANAGTGLGLALCKQYIELMQGTIALESKPGVGSTFTIAVPVTASSAPAPHVDQPDDDVSASRKRESVTLEASGTTSTPAPPSRRASEEPSLTARRRALVVDDNAVNRQVLQTQLSLLGLAVDAVCDGAAATEFIAKRLKQRHGDATDGQPHPLPDFVFMDDNMPIMNGRDATKAIRELQRAAAAAAAAASSSPDSNQDIVRSLPQQVKIVALTASDRSAAADAFFEAGADEFLTKPTTLAQLKQTIESLS